MAELLNCPFCGGPAFRRELIEHYPADADGPAGSYSAWFHIGCVACGIEVGDEYESTAATAWNRRAASSPSIEREVSGEGGAEPLPQRYMAADVLRVIEEYGVARYSEGVDDALCRQQEAAPRQSVAEERLNDLRLMLSSACVTPCDGGKNG